MTRKQTTQKYFMLTRGRTGSTAILDELGTLPDVVSAQEYFLIWSWPDGHVGAGTLRDMFRSILPFEAWKTRLERPPPSAAHREQAAATRIRRLQTAIRRFPRLGEYAEQLLDRKLYEFYLNYMERTALTDGTSRLIFKVLSNNLLERKGLAGILKARGYRVLHLVRNNLVRQVLSGQIANKRGVFNEKNYAGDSSSYSVDVDEFEKLVKMEKMRVDEDRAMLRRMGFDTLEVSYEAFCDNREQFYVGILEFMGLPVELPGKTDYSIMTDDLRSLIANYEEVEARVARMGLEDSLIENGRAKSG